MRIISIDEKSSNLQQSSIIKSRELSQHKRLGAALERTLSRCSEIHAEYELQTTRLREAAEKQGYTSGFKLFFSQLIDMLDEYERRQNERFSELRSNVIMAIKSSLHDPTIVERIIHHLHEKSGQQKALRIIIPHEVQLPSGVDLSNYHFTDDNHITVQNDMDAIRFPSEALCHQWLAQAESEICALNASIGSLIPEILNDIGNQLIALSNNKKLEPHDSVKEN